LLYSFYLKPLISKQKSYKNRITSDKLNNWLLEICEKKILNRAINYLEIDRNDMNSSQFIIIPYPVFHQTKNIKDEYIHRVLNDPEANKKSTDNNIDTEKDYYNYSYWNIQILILSSEYISFYFCGYNMLKNDIINERSNEYFYQDVATIKTESNEVSFQSKWHEEPISEARITKIIHNSGDILKLITEIPSLKQPPTTIVNIEKVEKTIRLLLRHTRSIDKNKKPVTINFKSEVTDKEEVEL
jgi:hypothetical protein